MENINIIRCKDCQCNTCKKLANEDKCPDIQCDECTQSVAFCSEYCPNCLGLDKSVSPAVK